MKYVTRDEIIDKSFESLKHAFESNMEYLCEFENQLCLSMWIDAIFNWKIRSIKIFGIELNY